MAPKTGQSGTLWVLLLITGIAFLSFLQLPRCFSSSIQTAALDICLSSGWRSFRGGPYK